MSDNRSFIMETYEWAVNEHLVHSKREFAAKVGVSRTYLSRIFSGDCYRGKVIARKVAEWKEKLEAKNAPRAQERTPLSKAWMEFRKRVAETAMASMINSCSTDGIFPDPDEVCGMAIVYADKLIELLKEGEE